MSVNSFSNTDLPLNERELQQLRRLLGDPFSYPSDLWTWIKTRIEEDPPAINSEAILGFGTSVTRAVPASPAVDLAVDVSVANTDLPGPGNNYSSVWQINPGGGSLRTIEKKAAFEGQRVTLIHDFFGVTTLKHNAAGPGGEFRPLFLHDGADIVLTVGDTIDLVHVDTFWKDVALVQSAAAAPPPGPLIQQGSVTSPALSNSTLYAIPVTFPVAFTTVTRVFIQLASHSAGFGVNDIAGTGVDSLTTTGFNLMLANGARNSGTYTFYWMALGT